MRIGRMASYRQCVPSGPVQACLQAAVSKVGVLVLAWALQQETWQVCAEHGSPITLLYTQMMSSMAVHITCHTVNSEGQLH